MQINAEYQIENDFAVTMKEWEEKSLYQSKTLQKFVVLSKKIKWTHIGELKKGCRHTGFPSGPPP